MSANTEVEVNVTEGSDWLTFTGKIEGMGSQFPYMVFEAAPNTGTDERTATVKVKEKGTSDDKAITLTMTQKEKDLFIPAGDTEFSVEGSEEKVLTLDFATNVSYLENISAPSWIIPYVEPDPEEATKTNSAKEGQLKYKVLKSTEYTERVGTITIVKYGTETEMVKYTVNQSGNPILTIDPTFIDGIKNGIDPVNKAFNIKVTQNLPEYPTAISSADWARLTRSADGFTLNVEKNESGADRTATLTFSDPSGKATSIELSLKQKK